MEPFRWGGTIGRRPYFLAGFSLTLVKLALDVSVANFVFGRPWSLRRYVIPAELLGIADLNAEDRAFFLTLVGLALPFIFIGLNLTVQRLRDARMPLWMVVLFFAPLPVNLCFLLIAALLPGRPPSPGAVVDPGLAFLPTDKPTAVEEPYFIADGWRSPNLIGRWMPENDWACGLVAILATIPIGLGLGFLSVNFFESYGWGLFVGLPVVMPMLAVLIYALPRPRRVGECLMVGLGWFALMFLSLVIFAFEGLVCLILLTPLALPLVMTGALLGYAVQLVPWAEVRSPRTFLILLAAQPLLIGAESVLPRKPPLFEVTTTIDVDAPPSEVWKHVVAFSELPPPDDWVFSTGIAYPKCATIRGSGPGAIRYCVFSTGPFVEPIEVWDEPHRLGFSVAHNPPPMKEWSPILEIHPPHLDNYMVSRRGEFRLIELPGGRTRLEGTTWYNHAMWPSAYWRIWSDGIIRRIHLQVLRHVKRLAEEGAGAPGEALGPGT
ncbi:MAG: SRPBCC family protein [Isosphaeraceae bacterium]